MSVLLLLCLLPPIPTMPGLFGQIGLMHHRVGSRRRDSVQPMAILTPINRQICIKRSQGIGAFRTAFNACRSARSFPARGHVWHLQPRRHVKGWAPAVLAPTRSGKVCNESAAEAAPAPDKPPGIPQGRQRQPDQPASPARSLSAPLEPFNRRDRWHRHHRLGTILVVTCPVPGILCC